MLDRGWEVVDPLAEIRGRSNRCHTNLRRQPHLWVWLAIVGSGVWSSSHVFLKSNPRASVGSSVWSCSLPHYTSAQSHKILHWSINSLSHLLLYHQHHPHIPPAMKISSFKLFLFGVLVAAAPSVQTLIITLILVSTLLRQQQWQKDSKGCSDFDCRRFCMTDWMTCLTSCHSKKNVSVGEKVKQEDPSWLF
jgi:hypothetical protein